MKILHTLLERLHDMHLRYEMLALNARDLEETSAVKSCATGKFSDRTNKFRYRCFIRE